MTFNRNVHNWEITNQWDQEGMKHLEMKWNKGQEINDFHANLIIYLFSLKTIISLFNILN